MGAVLETPANATPWNVEIRRESSYLSIDYDDQPITAKRSGSGVGPITFILPARLARSLVPAIDVLLAHPQFPHVEAHEDASWTVTADHDTLIIAGRGYVYFEDTDGAADLSRTLEIEHDDLQALRAAIVKAL